MLIASCSFDDSFNLKLLDDFKSFKNVVENNSENIKGEYFDIADDYHWITESNFENLFQFTTPDFRNRFQTLFKNKEITKIKVWDKKCIQFRIRPDHNNSLLKSEWNELWIIYNSGCDCKCQNEINEIKVLDKNIAETKSFLASALRLAQPLANIYQKTHKTI